MEIIFISFRCSDIRRPDDPLTPITCINVYSLPVATSSAPCGSEAHASHGFFIRSSVRPSVRLFASLPVCLLFCLSACLPIRLPAACLFLWLSVCSSCLCCVLACICRGRVFTRYCSLRLVTVAADVDVDANDATVIVEW
jgi:hypothetical protein